VLPFDDENESFFLDLIQGGSGERPKRRCFSGRSATRDNVGEGHLDEA
jgi:hypothetical protein